jgi:agmatinase
MGLSSPVGPADGRQVPRFAGPGTFARLPRADEVPRFDVAVVGVPFDSGTSYRPGARFGPAHVRQSSRLLRPYHPALKVSPFAAQQVVDAGDVTANPFDIAEAITQIEQARPTRTARRSAGRPRRSCSCPASRCTWGSAARCTTPPT